MALFRRTEYAREPSRARHAGYVLCRPEGDAAGSEARPLLVAHTHVARTSPHDDEAETADPYRRPRPLLPPGRTRRHTQPDIPPGRRLARGQERNGCRPQGHRRILLPATARPRDESEVPSALLPVHRAEL